MKQLSVVAPIYIQKIWGEVKPFLESGMTHSGGEYNVDQLKVFLTQGTQVLLVIADETRKIHGALTIEWINYPNERVAFVTCVGGRLITGKDLWASFEDWVKQNGGTLIRGAAYKEVAQLWKRKFNVEERYIMVEKRL
jgi:hypothetical protein